MPEYYTDIERENVRVRPLTSDEKKYLAGVWAHNARIRINSLYTEEELEELEELAKERDRAFIEAYNNRSPRITKERFPVWAIVIWITISLVLLGSVYYVISMGG